MKGITYTQVAQYCVLITAYTVPAIFIALQVTGTPIPQLAFGATLPGESVTVLEKLDAVVTDLGFRAYTEGAKSTLDVFCVTAALMAGTAGLPHVIVRFFTVPKVSDAPRSAFGALAFIAVLYTTAPAVGALARLNLHATLQPGPMVESTGSLSYAERPSWMKTWEATGLLRFEDKNGDGRIQYYGDSHPAFEAQAEAYGWAGNELTVDPDILVLANPEIAGLPDWVIALIAAGALPQPFHAALLVISSAVSHDLLGTFSSLRISKSFGPGALRQPAPSSLRATWAITPASSPRWWPSPACSRVLSLRCSWGSSAYE